VKKFDVQTVEINAPFARTFDYIADAQNLPQWTSAFKSVSGAGRALMRTPQGVVDVALIVHATREQGTIDWAMTFPDGNVAKAYSRVVDAGKDRSIYSFILVPPPVPLEQLEGTLHQQSQILREELSRLTDILDGK